MKKLSPALLFTIVLLYSSLISSAQEKTPQLGHDPVADIVKQMTLEEKVRVVVGKGFSVPGLNMGANDTTPDRLVAISGHTIPNSRFGIPSIGMADGPAGIHRFVMSAKDSA